MQSAHASTIADDLRAWLGRSLRVVVPIGCSAALLVWLFHKVDFADVMHVVRHHVDYWWILAMLVFNFLSYIIRAARWGLQLSGVGVKVPYPMLCVSIMGAYALNLLFTGFGEAWRCIFVSRRQHAQLSTVVGTDIGDRSSDAVVVLLVLALMMTVQADTVHAFLAKYAIGKDVERFADNPWMWCGIALVVGAGWSVLHWCKRYKLVDAVDGCIDRMWQGFKVIFTMKRKTSYLLLTLGIWACYFMQTYICFLAFPFTRELMGPEYCYGLMPGLAALTFGSLSMAIPSSGGLGPWNLAIMFALSAYGVSDTDGAAFALLLWTAEALLQIVLGISSMVYVMKTKETPQQS